MDYCYFDNDVDMDDVEDSNSFEIVNITPGHSPAGSDQDFDDDANSSGLLDPAADQGEGVRGEYIRMPNGERLQGMKRKRLYLGDACRCGNGKMIQRSKFSSSGVEYKFLACSDFRAGAGCTVTESINAPQIPKFFFRSPVPSPSGMNIIFNFMYTMYITSMYLL